ncbi:hypothetical protein I307_04195 [Cryptococcus deuterogattii 99/473]|uniref:Unplaced genomic scaffold supercont1.2, whole genome shotgun sequence n=1 Tax=Cryptococcus deuterogattii Ram5 TaxID=1296110 RepID=A0A0D0V9F5_9TREE|nr:hypothetical protein I313_01268 [Cryptococcus deuterogattii Ram5]KIY56396.1 hypothetical protein I307_04195 [Cryptococcus deuterogattii 99/473]
MDIDSPPSNSIPDPHSHVTLPSFSASFPLPFRVLFLVGLATLLWALNLHLLAAIGIDISAVLDLRDDPGGDGRISLEADDDGGERAEQGILSPRGQPLNTAGIALTLNEDTPMHPANTRIARPSANKLYGPMYKLFLMYCGWVGAAWVLFRSLSGEEEEAMERWRVIPGLAMVGVVAAVAVPWRGVLERERAGFRRAIKRILLPRINDPIHFSDVILADILTSFAKVLGDLWISTIQIWCGGITQGRVSQRGWSNYITLLMVSLPYMLRFRQCLLEYYQSSWQSPRPLANALKYFSAFPVILLSALQKSVVSDIASQKGITVQELTEQHDRWFGEHRLFRLWLLAVCVNSMYSFWWDVEMDWGLALCEADTWLGAKKEGGGRHEGWIERMKKMLRKRRDVHHHQRSPCPTPAPFNTSPPASPTRIGNGNGNGNGSGSTKPFFAFGLRSTLLLPDPLIYHLFTIVDLVLRFTWSLKLSNRLHTISEIESGVFLMETLELVRRWMWVFIRAEWEAVKMKEHRWGKGKLVWEEEDE